MDELLKFHCGNQKHSHSQIIYEETMFLFRVTWKDLFYLLSRFSCQPTNAYLILPELKQDTACPEMFAVIGNGKSEEGTLKVCFVNQSQF